MLIGNRASLVGKVVSLAGIVTFLLEPIGFLHPLLVLGAHWDVVQVGGHPVLLLHRLGQLLVLGGGQTGHPALPLSHLVAHHVRGERNVAHQVPQLGRKVLVGHVLGLSRP